MSERVTIYKRLLKCEVLFSWIMQLLLSAQFIVLTFKINFMNRFNTSVPNIPHLLLHLLQIFVRKLELVFILTCSFLMNKCIVINVLVPKGNYFLLEIAQKKKPTSIIFGNNSTLCQRVNQWCLVFNQCIVQYTLFILVCNILPWRFYMMGPCHDRVVYWRNS